MLYSHPLSAETPFKPPIVVQTTTKPKRSILVDGGLGAGMGLGGEVLKTAWRFYKKMPSGHLCFADELGKPKFIHALQMKHSPKAIIKDGEIINSKKLVSAPQAYHLEYGIPEKTAECLNQELNKVQINPEEISMIYKSLPLNKRIRIKTEIIEPTISNRAIKDLELKNDLVNIYPQHKDFFRNAQNTDLIDFVEAGKANGLFNHLNEKELQKFKNLPTHVSHPHLASNWHSTTRTAPDSLAGQKSLKLWHQAIDELVNITGGEKAINALKEERRKIFKGFDNVLNKEAESKNTFKTITNLFSEYIHVDKDGNLLKSQLSKEQKLVFDLKKLFEKMFHSDGRKTNIKQLRDLNKIVTQKLNDIKEELRGDSEWKFKRAVYKILQAIDEDVINAFPKFRNTKNVYREMSEELQSKFWWNVILKKRIGKFSTLNKDTVKDIYAEKFFENPLGLIKADIEELKRQGITTVDSEYFKKYIKPIEKTLEWAKKYRYDVPSNASATSRDLMGHGKTMETFKNGFISRAIQKLGEGGGGEVFTASVKLLKV